MPKEDPTRAIGQRIKKLREQSEFTQAKLAAEANITPAAISQIEKGERIPSTPILRRMAAALKVSTDYLLGATDETKLKDILQDEKVQNFFRGFQDLSPRDKQTIQQQIEFLKNQSKK